MRIVLTVDEVQELIADYVEKNHNTTSRAIDEGGIEFLDEWGVKLAVTEIMVPMVVENE